MSRYYPWCAARRLRPNQRMQPTGRGGPEFLVGAKLPVGNFPWSLDGTTIAVDGNVGDQFGLVLVPLQGTPQLLAVERLFLPTHIAWAPDGNRLAYVARDAADAFGVFLINRDGSGKRQLSTPGNTALTPAWMPDPR